MRLSVPSVYPAPSLPPYREEFDASASLVICIVRHLPLTVNKTLLIRSFRFIACEWYFEKPKRKNLLATVEKILKFLKKRFEKNSPKLACLEFIASKRPSETLLRAV